MADGKNGNAMMQIGREREDFFCLALNNLSRKIVVIF
jgi:hypothetical protein